MKLADWMHAHQMTPKELRRILGIKSRTTVGRWLAGERIPSPTFMNKIEDLTNGEVMLQDFLDPSPPRCLRFVTDRRGRVREVHPWTDIERDDPRLAGSGDRSDQGATPPWEDDHHEDAWPSPPLQRALDTLGARATVSKHMQFTLDGRRSDARRIVNEANRIRAIHNLPPIVYPSVHDPEQ